MKTNLFPNVFCFHVYKQKSEKKKFSICFCFFLYNAIKKRKEESVHKQQ
jgi:hypothetical protein